MTTLQEPVLTTPAAVLASPWRRLGALLLNVVLLVVTLVVGYLVWTMLLWKQGTNPAKKMLGMTVVSAEEGTPLTWNQMFLRSFVFGTVGFAVVNSLTGGAFQLLDALMVFGEKRQRLLDRVCGSQVVMRVPTAA